jgi:DNA polymerase III alpha subunit (gram-positive type)
MKLFFDTETTGLPNYDKPAHAEGQPRLVQIASILDDEEGKEVASMNLIIRPHSFEIPQETVKIHGITTEYAIKHGVYADCAINMFSSMLSLCTSIIGHNVNFDKFIMTGELLRQNCPTALNFLNTIGQYCTQQNLINVCRIQGKDGSFKRPRLQEAYKHAFGEEFEGWHNAMSDVKATRRLYYWLEERENKK